MIAARSTPTPETQGIMEELDPLDDDQYVSKTKRKQAMQAMQDLGQELVELPPDRLKRFLEKVELSETLANALREYQRLPKREAQRRQLQYIGKLMRDVDPEPLQAALDVVNGASAAENAKLHRRERLRTLLLENEALALADIAAQWPQADLTHLRQLRRSALKEQEQNKPPKSFRAIFQLLKELEDGAAAPGEEA